jgi:predicted XRE-type DNA-binding protein
MKPDQMRSAIMGSIAATIKEQGLTQQRVSEMIGTTQGRVSNLVNGRIDLFSLDNLITIASKLGLIVSLQIKDDPKRGLRSYTGKPVK